VRTIISVGTPAESPVEHLNVQIRHVHVQKADIERHFFKGLYPVPPVRRCCHIEPLASASFKTMRRDSVIYDENPDPVFRDPVLIRHFSRPTGSFTVKTAKLLPFV
jgi:hypothetical protein